MINAAEKESLPTILIETMNDREQGTQFPFFFLDNLTSNTQIDKYLRLKEKK